MINKLLGGIMFIGIGAFALPAQSSSFESILACYTSADAPGIAVRIDQAGKPIYSAVAGLANLKTRQPLQIDDVFQIGSVTKTFTAAAILKLVDAQKLSLSDPIGNYIPDINPELKHLTIERVLSHSAGLPDYVNDEAVNNLWHRYATLDEVIKTISTGSPLFAMGREYRYSNSGYLYLGKIIELVSGKSYHDYLRDSFFIPLNMNNTFVIEKGVTAGNVTGYTRRESAPDTYLEPALEQKWLVDRSWISAAGAIASTLTDMSRWQIALHSGKVISNHNYHLMTTQTKLNNGELIHYGLGLNVYPISNKLTYNHEGMVPGYFSWMVYFPDDDLTAIALTNNDTQHPGPALLDMIAVQLNLSPKPINQPELNLVGKALEGRYRTADGNILTITFEDQQLYSQLQSQPKRKLIVREDNAYSYQCTEDYYQLNIQDDKTELVPISIYQGKQPPMLKL